MKSALVHGERVCEIVTPGNEFEVADGLQWVECADDVTTTDTYVDGVFVTFMPPLPTPADVAREAERRIDQGLVLSLGVRFRCDVKSVSRISAIKDRPADRFPQSFKTAAGVDVTIPNVAAAVAVFNEVADYIDAIMVASAVLQDTLPLNFTDDSLWPSDQ